MTTSCINLTWMWVVIHKLLCPRCATLSLRGQKLMFSLYERVQQLGPPGLSPSPHLPFSYLLADPFPLPPAPAAAQYTFQTVAQGCCHWEEVGGWKHGLCQDGGFWPGQRAGAAMGHCSLCCSCCPTAPWWKQLSRSLSQASSQHRKEH